MAQFLNPRMSNGLGWPTLSYPNKEASEEQVLENVRQAINPDVACVLLEPVNWQTGQSMSSSLIS